MFSACRGPTDMSDDYTAWVGRRVSRSDIATERLQAEFVATLSPYLFDDGQDDHLPPGLHWALAPARPLSSETRTDGTEARGIFLPPIDLPRRMWAGGTVETLGRIRLGQTITRVSTIVSVRQVEGRSGPLCFVSITHDLLADGAKAIAERQDLVFRADRPRMAGAPAPAAPWSADLSWRVTANPLLLFRFSALTFNGHRIHYDVDYARDIEGYAGLVVHGPLQAALLLNQSAVALGHVPRKFEYRCLAPLIGDSDLVVETHGDSGRIVDAAGTVTAEARSAP
jgi:3-methylfumaryl-CoA hydratase